MPACFKDSYPSTRCASECTEIFVQVPSLVTQRALYSHYKYHPTYKALVGIGPSSAITFVSQLYPGSLWDKEIVSRCGILHLGLWEKGDSIVADRGFTIQDSLDPFGVNVNIPAFLYRKDLHDKEDGIITHRPPWVSRGWKLLFLRTETRFQTFQLKARGMKSIVYGHFGRRTNKVHRPLQKRERTGTRFPASGRNGLIS